MTPYFAHPVRVAMVVRDLFGCDDAAALAAAFLHDTLEDTPADYDEIAEAFSTDIADLVAALSQNMLLPENERDADYDARLMRASWRARLVKLADVFDNACDLETRSDASSGTVIRRHIGKMDRAMVLAQRDAVDHPETARAIAEVERVRQELRARVHG